MLQSLDRIGVKNGFVDLHNHTDRSYGEERNKMNISPVELLETALNYSQSNNGAQVTFSITDHNNFDSVFEIKEKIAENPELYKNVRFIKGCEFSCGGSSFGKIVDSAGEKHRIIKGFHVLAYDFDENNKRLKFVSSLYNDSFENSFVRDGVKIASGRYILSIRNLLFEDGYYAPLKWFYNVNLNTENITQQAFVGNLINICKEKLNLPEDYCKTLYSKLFSVEFFKTFKVEAKELAEIVHDAGGYIVLAHPSLIRYSHSYETEFASTINQKYKNMSQVSFVIDNLKKFVSPYTGKRVRGLVGMEVLHSSSFKSNCFEKLLKLANDYKLYITGGSDSHGTLLQPYFSEIFPRRFSLGLGLNIMAMSRNLFASRIWNKTLKNNYTCSLPLTKQTQIVEGSVEDDRVLTLEDILARDNETVSRKKKQKAKTTNITKAMIKNQNNPKNWNKKKKHKYYPGKDNGRFHKNKQNKYRKDYENDENFVKIEKIRKKSLKFNKKTLDNEQEL